MNDLMVLVVRSEEKEEVTDGCNKGEVEEKLEKEKEKKRRKMGGRWEEDG